MANRPLSNSNSTPRNRKPIPKAASPTPISINKPKNNYIAVLVILHVYRQCTLCVCDVKHDGGLRIAIPCLCVATDGPAVFWLEI